MARPKLSRPTAELKWRVPLDLIEWAKAEASRAGLEPGVWLTGLLERTRAPAVNSGTTFAGEAHPRLVAPKARPTMVEPRFKR